MRNHLRWLFLLLFGIALIGCQDDLNVNSPVNNQSGSGFNKVSPAIEILTKDLDLTGSKIYAAGEGTLEIGTEGSGTINITIPSGTIKKAILYWESRHHSSSALYNSGDPEITVNGNNIKGELIGQAALNQQRKASTLRADVTNLISVGPNTLNINDFQYTVGTVGSDNNYVIDRPDGVGLLVVVDDGSSSFIDVRDGADYAYKTATVGVEQVTVPQTFNFPASAIERTAELTLFAGDVGVDRPNSLKITVGNVTTTLDTPPYPFHSNKGPQWDVVVLPITIPAGVNSVTVEPISGPGGETNAASIVWITAAFTVPTPVLKPASIGNFVWWDLDKDGVQDDDENDNGVPNVKVELYNCEDPAVRIAETFTDAVGLYLFDNLVPGDYKVKFYPPDGYEFTLKDVAITDEFNDSDADLTTGFTICTTLDPGEYDKSWDAGLVEKTEPLNKIGDFVWHDKDVDGIQDANEPGIKDVVVELLSGNVVIKTTTTDDNGKYLFTDLPNGNYCVRVAASNYAVGGVLYSTAQTKWYATKKNQGADDAKDSDANKNESVCTDLNNNDDLTLDFGFYKTCVSVTKLANKTTAKPGETITYTFVVENCGDITLGGGVDLFDAMLNPTAPHKIGNLTPVYPGTTKTLTKTYCVTTKDCGDLVNVVKAVGHPVDGSANVEFTASVTVKIDCPPAPSKLGDKVWLDKDNDGLQDYGEDGVKNVKVELYDCAGKLLASTYTNYYGIYYFTNLTPGDYKVKFYAPTGYGFTKKDQGTNDAKDSDVDLTTGFTTCITLGAGKTDLTWDAGIVCLPKSKLGDKVWLDKDKDGIQDSGEPGVKDVKVRLYNCSGTLLATTYTNYYGNYSFSNLNAGEYQIKFYLPTGYAFTKKDQGSNDEKDSDANLETGLTTCITLGAGVTDLKWDAGLVQKSSCYSPGYWKTHSKYGPANPYDQTWKNCGTLGEDTPFFNCGGSWYKTFWKSTDGNPYYILAHQYMAAKLNFHSGAFIPSDIKNALNECETLFGQYTPNQVKYGSSTVKAKFLNLASLLDKFNNQ